MHLLHLVEPWSEARAQPLDRIAGSDAAAEGAAACLATESYHTQAAILVGPRSAEIRARALGARTFDTVCPINRSRRHGVALLNRVLAHRTAPERIILWSSHLHSWAEQLATPVLRPWDFDLGETSLRAKGGRGHSHLRAVMRAELGIDEASLVIALADDPPMEADLWQFATILAMLETTGVAVVGLAPVSAHQRGRGRRFLWAQGLSQGLVLIEEPVWSFSPAIDLAIVGAGVSARARDFGERAAASAREFTWGRVMAAERMQIRGVPTITADAAAIAPSLRSQMVAADGRSSSLAAKLLPLAESADARQEIELLLGRGVPAHAQSLAVRLLWKLTALPGDVEPTEEELAAVPHG